MQIAWDQHLRQTAWHTQVSLSRLKEKVLQTMNYEMIPFCPVHGVVVWSAFARWDFRRNDNDFIRLGYCLTSAIEIERAKKDIAEQSHHWFQITKGTSLKHLHNNISLAMIRSQLGCEIGKTSPQESGKEKNCWMLLFIEEMGYVISVYFKLKHEAKELTPYVWKGRSDSIYLAIVCYVVFDFSIIIIRSCYVKMKWFSQKDGQSASSTAMNKQMKIKTL